MMAMELGRKSRIAAAAALIAAPLEGTYLYAYKDPGGVLTVCTWHTGADIVRGQRYSLEQCKALLEKDMLVAVEAVERCHPGLPDDIAIAFSDAVFNVGPKVACESTAAKRLAEHRYVEACNELPKWNKQRIGGVLVPLPGLTNRRALEREVCLRGAQ